MKNHTLLKKIQNFWFIAKARWKQTTDILDLSKKLTKFNQHQNDKIAEDLENTWISDALLLISWKIFKKKSTEIIIFYFNTGTWDLAVCIITFANICGFDFTFELGMILLFWSCLYSSPNPHMSAKNFRIIIQIVSGKADLWIFITVSIRERGIRQNRLRMWN